MQTGSVSLDPQPPATPPPTPAGEQPARNTLGLVALIIAIVGAIFACVPGALIVGWILLPVAFILSLVGLFQKGRKRGTSVAALIISVVGTIIGIIVFVAVVAGAVDEAFSDNTTAELPGAVENTVTEEEPADAEDPGEAAAQQDEAGEPETEAAPAEADGTRANPYPLGTRISTEEWAVTVNSVDLDATEAVVAENMFNDEPEAGHTYILVNITAEYTGSDADGDSPWVRAEYVSAGGNTFDSTDAFAVAPDAFDQLKTLYEGASTTGNVVLMVPTDQIEEGAVRITPSLFGDALFVAVS